MGPVDKTVVAVHWRGDALFVHLKSFVAPAPDQRHVPEVIAIDKDMAASLWKAIRQMAPPLKPDGTDTEFGESVLTTDWCNTVAGYILRFAGSGPHCQICKWPVGEGTHAAKCPALWAYWVKRELGLLDTMQPGVVNAD